MRNAGLDEAQAGIKIARRNINNLRYADDTILIAENEEELKSLLMKVKEKHEKGGFKHSKNEDMEQKLATHSSILAWRISWTEEPGGLQSMGLQRVGHYQATKTHTFVLQNCVPMSSTCLYEKYEGLTYDTLSYIRRQRYKCMNEPILLK